MARVATRALSFPFGIAVGTGVGGAVGGAIEPRLQGLRNEAWRLYQSYPLEAQQAAELVASGERGMEWGIDEALNVGVNEERFRALVDMVDTAPDLSTLMELWRRGEIGDGDFAEGARKGTIEQKWIPPLQALKRRLLSPAELANAVVQGHRSQVDAAADAARQGVNDADFGVMVANTGLPPGPETLQAWRRRGIIDDGGLDQGIREGHIKTKYIDEYHASLQQILSPQEWAGLWLRGWATEAEAKAGGAAWGYSADDMERMYLNRGRPATVRQIHIGYARGATLPGVANEEAAIRRSVRQSNIRTEYADLLYAQRYTLPSPFVMRSLTQAGTWSQEKAEARLIDAGWIPQDAAEAAADWAGGSATGPSAKWADRAKTRVFTEAWNDYLDGNADEAELRALLAAVGAVGAEQDTIVTLATTVRGRTRRDLTQAQVLKLYKKTIWAREQAQAALEDQGMAADDASDLLDSV